MRIVFSADDLCAHCPNMIEGLCKDNEKVSNYDNKVAAHFNIEDKIYIYQDITQEIREKMSAELLKDICMDCEWFSICKTRTGI